MTTPQPTAAGISLPWWSLLIAPVVGLVAVSAAPNPAGEGPGAMQVVLGVLVPPALSLLVSHRRGSGISERIGWAAASVVATGVLLGVAALLVTTVIRPA